MDSPAKRTGGFAWKTLCTAALVAGAAGVAGVAAASTPSVAAHSAPPRLAHDRPGATPGNGLNADDSLQTPPWWHGLCDVNAPGHQGPASFPNGAVFDGLVSCGPGPNQLEGGQHGVDNLVHFFNGAWGEYEWECVELSMRWMYQAWGVDPYGANGNGVVPNYPLGSPGYPRLERIANGTRQEAPQPGDVISVDNANPNGHTEVIAASSVNSAGDGTLRAITENWGSGNGWVNLSVHDWVVSDGIAGDRVIGWLHNPNWHLQIPVSWWVSPSRDLWVSDSGSLNPSPVKVASGIASAQVVGGQGDEPSPLVAALTGSGALEAGWVVPNTPLVTVATGVSSFSVSTGFGRPGRPLLAWVTSTGALKATSSFRSTPLTLLPSGVRQVVLAPNSAPLSMLVGVLTAGGRFEVATGRLGSTLSWSTIATNATEIGLAGGGQSPSAAIEAYVSRGGYLYDRQSSSSPFSLVAGHVRQFSVATVGSVTTPLLAYVTTLGQAYVQLGSEGWINLSNSASSVSVSAGLTPIGFPVVSYIASTGQLFTKQGLLTATAIQQTRQATSGGASALVVS